MEGWFACLLFVILLPATWKNKDFDNIHSNYACDIRLELPFIWFIVAIIHVPALAPILDPTQPQYLSYSNYV